METIRIVRNRSVDRGPHRDSTSQIWRLLPAAALLSLGTSVDEAPHQFGATGGTAGAEVDLPAERERAQGSAPSP